MLLWKQRGRFPHKIHCRIVALDESVRGRDRAGEVEDKCWLLSTLPTKGIIKRWKSNKNTNWHQNWINKPPTSRQRKNQKTKTATTTMHDRANTLRLEVFPTLVALMATQPFMNLFAPLFFFYAAQPCEHRKIVCTCVCLLIMTR